MAGEWREADPGASGSEGHADFPVECNRPDGMELLSTVTVEELTSLFSFTEFK